MSSISTSEVQNDATHPARPTFAALAVVYVTVFLDLVGFGIILPQLPFFAERFGATGVWVGALMTSYSAAQLLGAPVLGRLSDRFGRRPAMLSSLVGSVGSLVLTGLATSLPVLLVGRSLAGLFGGSIAVAQAYVADTTRPEERSKYMGLLGASIGLGFVFGPAMGAGLSRFGFGAAALTAAGLGAVNLGVAAFKLPESHPPAARGQGRARMDLAALRSALAHPRLGRVLAATFLSTFAFVAMESTFALLGERRFHLGAGGLGGIFTFVGVVMVVVQGGMVGRLSKRFGEVPLAVAGGIISAAMLAALPYAPTLGTVMGVLGVLAASQGLLNPLLSTLLSRLASREEQGGTLGLGQSFSAAARGLGPITAGVLFDLGESLPYVAAGAVMLSAALLLPALSRSSEPHPL